MPIASLISVAVTLAATAAAENGTNTADDRKALGKEMGALATEINRISTQTTFAGKTVLNGLVAGSIFGEPAAGGPGGGGNGPTVGKTGTMNLQVGSNKGDTISFSVESVYFSKIAGVKELVAEKDVFFNASKNGLVTVDMTKVTFGPPAQGQGAQGKTIGDVIALMDTAIATVDGMRADLGAIQNRLESSIRNQSNVAANEADARSRIRDADFAEESANLSQQSIIQQAAASMLMQANTRPQLGLSLLG